MNEIAQMVAQKFNLSPEVAQQIVDFIVGQVKGKLPDNLSQHVDGLLAGGADAEGLVVALAKLIMPGSDPGGIWITMLLGIAGSFLGTCIGRLLGWYQEGQSAGFIMSLIGALILLGLYHLYKRKTA